MQKMFFLALALGLGAVEAADVLRPKCADNRVTFITDSHGNGPFGEHMDQFFLTFPDFELRTFSLGGSSPWWFIRGDKGFGSPFAFIFDSCTQKELPSRQRKGYKNFRSQDITIWAKGAADYKNDLFVFLLGTNVPGVPSVYFDQTKELMDKLKASSPAATCVWIGPPRMRGNDGLMKQVIGHLKKAIEGRCEFIDSRPYSAYPATGGDGIHYPFPAPCSTKEILAKKPRCEDTSSPWALGVIAELKKILNAKKIPYEKAL